MKVRTFGAPGWLTGEGWSSLGDHGLADVELWLRVTEAFEHEGAEGLVMFPLPWPSGTQSCDFSQEDFDRAMHCARASCSRALAAMRRHRFGRVVLVAPSFPILSPEMASGWEFSSWLNGLTRGLALESAADGVTINSVLIGMPAAVSSEAGFAPEELRHAIGLFLERSAGYLTGQVMHLCGGKSMVSVFSY